MGNKNKNSELFDKIIEGLKLVKDRVIQIKKEKGTPLVVMKEGKIIKIMPEDL